MPVQRPSPGLRQGWQLETSILSSEGRHLGAKSGQTQQHLQAGSWQGLATGSNEQGIPVAGPFTHLLWPGPGWGCHWRLEAEVQAPSIVCSGMSFLQNAPAAPTKASANRHQMPVSPDVICLWGTFKIKSQAFPAPV